MPPLKKKSEANVPEVPSWHPNFRNFQRLPDTKVVRTAFFINAVAITVAVVLLLFVGRREWELYVLKQQVAEKQQQIDQNKAGSDQAVGIFKKYQVEEAKLLEVQNFVESKLILSDLMIHLGQTLPKNIAFDRFDLRDTGLIIGATIRGASDEAKSALAIAYIEQLRTDEKITARFDEIKPANTGRTTTGRITLEISLRLKAIAPKGGKRP